MRWSSYLSVVLAVAGCQQLTTDNFINPPPGVPATCTPISSLPGCDEGSISYSCTSDRPDDVGSDAGKGDTAQLVCSDGVAGPDGAALYCCMPFSQYFSDCAPDTSVPGCLDPAVGFACTSEGMPPTAPSDTDPTIVCSAAQPGVDGAVDYCCNTVTTPPQCVATGSGATCPGIAVGYDCSSDVTPVDSGAPLACAAGSAGSGGTPYCCVPFEGAANTCVVDASVACAATTIPFSCSGTNTPDALDPALTCTQSGAGYCCEIE